MFGWLSDRFTNSGRLEKAARNLKTAANRYGTRNTRNVAKQAALKLEKNAETTKATVDMAEKALSDLQKKCAVDITNARNDAKKARADHSAVKDTTFKQIKRFVTLGPASWGLSRSAAVNLEQKQLANAAEKRRQQLQEIARKQQKAMDDEEAAFKRRKELIASALGTAKEAATEAKNSVVPLLSKKANNGGANEFENARGTYTPPNTHANTHANNESNPGTPGSTPKATLFNGLNLKGGSRRRNHSRGQRGGRTHRRR
jgi:hypothetical protein